METIERRRAAIRAETRGNSRRLVGFAARYGEVADIGAFRERIAPGAFAASLAGADILALLDHDPAQVLGRTRSGTLQLTDEAQGLAFDVSVPETTAGRDALALAERGDLGGASIGFVVEEEARDAGVRVVKRARLLEISIVSSWPAYAGTTVEARRRRAATPENAGASPCPSRTPRLDTLRRFLETI